LIYNPTPFLSKAENFNYENFKMVQAKELKIIASSPLEWHHLPTNIMKNCQAVQKFICGGQTDRLVTGKPTFIFGK
jgi:hypothetical protein